MAWAAPSDEVDGKKDGEKKVYVSFYTCEGPVRWMEIDPHNYYYQRSDSDDEEDSRNIVLESKPKINSPPSDLDLSKLNDYTAVVSDSKVYFIGGKFINTPAVLSDMIFTYDHLSDKWDKFPCNLNLARRHPIVVIVANCIYVFGGLTYDATNFDQFTNKQLWIECFSTNNNVETAKWEFLSGRSAPPDEVFEDYVPLYHFVYDAHIVFVTRKSGCYSFNYISKTWAPFLQNLDPVTCYKAIVIGDLLFWHYYGVIYAHDLRNNRRVLSQRLTQLKMSFGVVPEYIMPYSWLKRAFLQRIGKNTLALVTRDIKSDPEKNLHFYKFRIENLTTDADERISYNNIHLVQFGCGRFSAPSDVILDVVTI